MALTGPRLGHRFSKPGYLHHHLEATGKVTTAGAAVAVVAAAGVAGMADVAPMSVTVRECPLVS